MNFVKIEKKKQEKSCTELNQQHFTYENFTIKEGQKKKRKTNGKHFQKTAKDQQQ